MLYNAYCQRQPRLEADGRSGCGRRLGPFAQKDRSRMSMEDLYKKPGHLIRRVQQIAVAIFMDECADFDITPVQYASLFTIREHPAIDATRLSALVAFDRSTMGSVLERLEAKGYISRTPSGVDKRIKILRLTAKGVSLLAQVKPLVTNAQDRILGPLSPSEKESFVRMLEKMANMNNHVSRAPIKFK